MSRLLFRASLALAAMTGMIYILLLFLSAKPLSGDSTLQLPPGLGWQAHSQNDLRLWPQLAMKSVRSTLSIKVDPHVLTQNGFQLSHNTPVDGIMYNTTEDLLTACQEILQGWPALRLRIAMCFKSTPDPCSSSVEAEAWLAGVDQFYSKAEKLRSEFRGRLEFVMDGGAKPVSCLKDRWRPWNSTWIPNDSSPLAALFSNDVSEGYDRFAIMNPPDNSAEWLALRLARYGKFRRGSYPFQLWEPDSQDEITSYATDFLDGPHSTNPSLGLDFAINVDPQMFTVFTASASHQSWNLELPLQTPAASAPHLVTLTFGADRLLFVLYKASDRGTYMWSTFSSGFPFGKVSPLMSGVSKQQDAPIATVHEGNATVHVVTASSIERLTVSANGSVSSAGVKALSAAPLAACLHSAGVLAVLLPGVLSGTLEVKQIQNGSISETLWVTPTLPNQGMFAAADLVEVGGDFLATVSNGTHIFVAVSSSSSWALLSVGAHGSLSTTVTPDGKTMVALTADGGFCFNSHSHNTQEMPKVCDQIPTPCKTALDYTMGSFSQWVAFVKSSGLVTPCSELLHGTYDFGATPSSSLIAWGQSQVILLEVHAGASSSADTCGCGSPVPRPGKLVLDGFSMNLPNSGTALTQTDINLVV